jgi:lipoprotein-anchoring transpeptidase ErfK/SrfK
VTDASGRPVGIAAVCAALALLIAGCSGGASGSSGDGGSDAGANDVRLAITPAGGVDNAPNRGITVRAERGTISKVIARVGGRPVSGSLNASRTVWHSRWALNVSRRYTVTATGAGTSGKPVTKTVSFRTSTPKKTFDTQVIEGHDQTYGVGMPILLYFSRPITNKAAVERTLEVRTSRRVVGAWRWDDHCRTAPQCLYFRPRRYWRPGTRVSFTAHVNGVEGAPGVYGHHTLTQSFKIGRSLKVVASTAHHYMDVYRNGKHFAHWPISTGKPGDDTPNGTYLTIEKANPVEMVGPGYHISVPYSVRITWSGEYLHDAFWSTGDQGFANVSHGCVNMSPEHAAIYYRMSLPGDPVKITGSPRAGTWDNGWTMWFLSWKQWVRGSALHATVRAGPHGSRFVPVRLQRHRRH